MKLISILLIMSLVVGCGTIQDGQLEIAKTSIEDSQKPGASAEKKMSSANSIKFWLKLGHPNLKKEFPSINQTNMVKFIREAADENNPEALRALLSTTTKKPHYRDNFNLPSKPDPVKKGFYIRKLYKYGDYRDKRDYTELYERAYSESCKLAAIEKYKKLNLSERKSLKNYRFFEHWNKWVKKEYTILLPDVSIEDFEELEYLVNTYPYHQFKPVAEHTHFSLFGTYSICAKAADFIYSGEKGLLLKEKLILLSFKHPVRQNLKDNLNALSEIHAKLGNAEKSKSYAIEAKNADAYIKRMRPIWREQFRRKSEANKRKERRRAELSAQAARRYKIEQAERDKEDAAHEERIQKEYQNIGTKMKQSFTDQSDITNRSAADTVKGWQNKTNTHKNSKINFKSVTRAQDDHNSYELNKKKGKEWSAPKHETSCPTYYAQFVPGDPTLSKSADNARRASAGKANYQAWRTTQSSTCLKKHDASKNRPRNTGGGRDK